MMIVVAVAGFVAAVIASVVGFGIGSLLAPARTRSQRLFRRVVALLLVGLGLYMMITAGGA